MYSPFVNVYESSDCSLSQKLCIKHKKSETVVLLNVLKNKNSWKYKTFVAGKCVLILLHAINLTFFIYNNLS